MAKYIQCRAQRSQKYASRGKKLKIKVVQNRILSKKVHERICLSLPGVELGARKIGMFEVLFCRETANYRLNAAKNTHHTERSLK